MTAVTVSQAIVARLATLTAFDHFTGHPAATPARPYTAFFPAPPGVSDRRLNGLAYRSPGVSRAVCVNTSPDGALKVAQSVVDLLDGWEHAGALATCQTGPLIADPDMATGFRWSITVEIAHEAYR